MDGKPAPVLAKLRELGYWVDVHHKQFTYQEQMHSHYPHTQVRARTNVVVWTANKEELVAEGFAECSSEDQFNRTIGLRIALGRALHSNPELKAQVLS